MTFSTVGEANYNNYSPNIAPIVFMKSDITTYGLYDFILSNPQHRIDDVKVLCVTFKIRSGHSFAWK